MKHIVSDKSIRARSKQSETARRLRGVTILELIVTLGLLGVMLATLAPTLTWVHAQRRAANQRELATQELANLLERFMSHPWEEIISENTSEIELVTEIAARLPNAELIATVTEDSNEPISKQVKLELDWTNPQGDRVRPIRLSAFVHQQTESP